MTVQATPDQSGSWHATLRSISDALGVGDVDRARALAADACRHGRLRYGLRERLAGFPRLVTATMEAIDAALTVDQLYTQAARTCVLVGLEQLPAQQPTTWRQLRAARRQLSLAGSMAWLVPDKAREATALQQALDATHQALAEAGRHLAGAAGQAARLQATLREIRRTAAAVRADADTLIGPAGSPRRQRDGVLPEGRPPGE